MLSIKTRASVLLAFAVLVVPLVAQPTPPHPGWILVDDVFLPPDVVLYDSFYNATPWPGGVVPYQFDPTLPFDHRQKFREAIADIEAVCGVNFRPRVTDVNYIYVLYDPGFGGGYSALGQIGGAQNLGLGASVSRHLIIHELMHALGFEHEHQRPDRGTYISINLNNVSQTACAGPSPNGGSCNYAFNIINTGTPHGPYDFASVMHYGDHAWSVCNDPNSTIPCNGSSTTIDCTPTYASFQNVIGNRSNISTGDANGLITRYGSTNVTPTISGIQPGAIPQGSGNTFINIFGTGFHPGSLNGSGVLGTQVTVGILNIGWDKVQWISENELRVEVPASQFTSAGCKQVTVSNTYGGTSNPWSLGVSASVPSTGFVSGGSTNAFMGNSVAGLGDVNGDHYDDYVVGAYGTPLGGVPYSGQAVCVSGKDGAILWSRSGTFNQSYGFSMANADDVDGDGIDDLIVGAPGRLGLATPPIGFAYLISGADGSQIRPMTRFVSGDQFGFAVANAGDVNGDGVPDQIIGAPGSNLARIYSGSNGVTLRTIYGPSGEGFARSVTGGYRVDNDSVPDQIVGAPWSTSGRGKVYYYSGATGAVFHSKLGLANGDYFGESVALMPSPDQANGGALLVGAPRGSSNRGYVKMFRPYTGPFIPVGGTNYPEIATVIGLAANDYFGTSVCSAGDLNQDGRQDYAVGAPGTGSDYGYVHVFDGMNPTTRLEQDTGWQAGDRYGYAVAPAGDTNADGVPDLVVGAWRGAYGCSQEGYARTLHWIVPPSQKKVMISEVYWGARAAVEVTNYSDANVNIANWVVTWDDGTKYVSSPAPSLLLAPGTSAILMENTGQIVVCSTSGCTAANYYAGAPTNTPFAIVLPSISTGGQPFGVSLTDFRGQVVDEVRIKGDSPIAAIVQPSVGGHFRGYAPREPNSVSVERYWGLDSNSGGDWTAQPGHSLGLENRSSGPRGHDPIGVPNVLINETDDSPDYIEIKNDASYQVNLQNWFILASASQNSAHALIRPWQRQWTPVPSNGFMVVGDGTTPPAELPSWVPYVALSTQSSFGGGGNIPWVSEEYSCALYDSYGRCVDVVRTTGHDDVRVHNHPRAPSAPFDFVGAAMRSADGDRSIGRKLLNNDSDNGSDWVALYTRSMGVENHFSAYVGNPGLAGGVDVRLNGTPYGGGLTGIINAGPAFAGKHWSFAFSSGHQHGQGIFFGLGAEALNNWLLLNQDPLWSGQLDANGSARVDFETGVLPAGLTSDDIFIIQDAGGGLALRTAVIEWDM